ncbi:unnamed protein product [Fraxinus pennsylvanica]|uniref:Uncharacterized protein n=1 Tax=Fraxinus pennsylvanica TaxID=56036 RepID=A0AAD2AIH9_9LAMI|nr:unnamed protein product [Fraxinus pennsylvanica]
MMHWLGKVTRSNEQFLLDFEQLQIQFPDQVQLHAVTKFALMSLVIQCCIHALRAKFLLFALLSSSEMSLGQGSQTLAAVTSTTSSQSGILPSSVVVPNTSNFQSSNPASPFPSVHGIGSPAQLADEPSSCATLSPTKHLETRPCLH